MPEQTMASILGRPLTLGEDMAMSRMIQERMEIDTELARLKGEQQKLALEGERTRQAAIARAIESMAPRWERAGERVDVGMFQGKPVAVGPGPVGEEITPFGPRTQFVQPGVEQQRMGQQLVRTQMGLPAEDPEAVFDRQLRKLHEQYVAQEKLREAADIRTEERQRKAGLARETLEETKAKEKAKLEEPKEIARFRRDFQDKLATSLDKAAGGYKDIVRDLRKDPQFKLLPSIEQKAQLAELREEYEDWLDAIIERAQSAARNYGIEVDLPKVRREKEPSALSTEQIARFKELSTKDKRRFAKLYEQEYGKPFPVEVK